MRYCVATQTVPSMIAGRPTSVVDLADHGGVVPAGTWHAIGDDRVVLCGADLDPTYVFDNLDFRRGIRTGTDHCASCKLALVTVDTTPTTSAER